MRGAYLRMHLAIFLWGFTGILGKWIKLNEGLLVWYRMLLSALVLFIILYWRKELPRLPRRKLLHIASIGFIVMLHWVTFFGSIKLSSISVAMICLSSVALFAAFIEPLVNRKPLDYWEIVFSLFAVAGITTIYFSDMSATAGIISGLVCAFLSALFSTLNRRIASEYEPLTISFIELTSGWIFLTLLLPVYFRIQPTEKFLPDYEDGMYLMVLSIFCTVLTWILSLQALRKVSAYTMGLALNLEPVYGIILAVMFAGEESVINEWFLSGALIILFTVILHTIYRSRKSRKLDEKAG
ncbi:MAG: hypothetical protein RL213_237 [Bacteroidota bacterium]|jgi:drug/metabolite transporter (DMT)-like permease